VGGCGGAAQWVSAPFPSRSHCEWVMQHFSVMAASLHACMYVLEGDRLEQHRTLLNRLHASHLIWPPGWGWWSPHHRCPSWLPPQSHPGLWCPQTASCLMVEGLYWCGLSSLAGEVPMPWAAIPNVELHASEDGYEYGAIQREQRQLPRVLLSEVGLMSRCLCCNLHTSTAVWKPCL
jgi:hypothetical protein